MKAMLLLAVAFVLFSTPSFASKNSQSVRIWEDVTVGSTKLVAGDYKISWNGSGPEVQVTLARNGKSPVTVPAKLVQEQHKESGIVISDKAGTNMLDRIQLSHISLVFDGV